MTEMGGAPRARRTDATVTMDARLADLESRIAEMEQRAPSLRERGQGMMDRVMPPEAAQHFRNAAREQLLGMRAIVDFWIARVDQLDARAVPRERETIDVQ
jgi:hypothetical protein